jgi:VIT1/CCC1 family predicted Fe2+/Mn2+ transporter
MEDRPISEALMRDLLFAQRGEITEYHVYKNIAGLVGDDTNAQILFRIADDEKRHYEFWKRYTGRDVEPEKGKIIKYTLLSRFFGLTFAVKLMEKGERKAQDAYRRISEAIPEARDIEAQENEHEQQLIGMINEERLRYTGSIVLGLNDALVELTGALAGYTLALQRGSLIAMTGLITGIAAAMSMAASEYLSTKTELDNRKTPGKAAVYTGIAYIITVAILISPYMVIASAPAALLCTLAMAILIILAFTYYIAVAQDVSFRRRFLEMAAISLSVAAISFVVGWLIRLFFGVDV